MSIRVYTKYYYPLSSSKELKPLLLNYDPKKTLKYALEYAVKTFLYPIKTSKFKKKTFFPCKMAPCHGFCSQTKFQCKNGYFGGKLTEKPYTYL